LLSFLNPIAIAIYLFVFDKDFLNRYYTFLVHMPTVLSNKQKPLQHQNIFQHQSKHTKNREAHGGVRPDKRVDARARITSNQPAVFSDPMRERPLNTAIPRTKKRSKKRRLLQITSWVDEPLLLKLSVKARKKNLSMSATIRRLLRKVVSEDEEALDAALDAEMIMQSHARDTRALASRLSRLQVELLYDVGHIKVLVNNILGMQKGMTGDMLKDILQDADRRTKARLSRMNPELEPFIDAVVEKWLRGDGEGERAPGEDTNGNSGRGGSTV
jgi:hypothetical protein